MHLDAHQKKRLWWTLGLTGLAVAAVGTVAVVASAKTSSSSTGTSTDVIPPTNQPPPPPPPPPPPAGTCAEQETPSPNCQECAPSEVDAAVSIANDSSKQVGQYVVFVQASGHHITVNKSSQGFAQILMICLDANQSAQPTDVVL